MPRAVSWLIGTPLLRILSLILISEAPRWRSRLARAIASCCRALGTSTLPSSMSLRDFVVKMGGADPAADLAVVVFEADDEHARALVNRLAR